MLLQSKRKSPFDEHGSLLVILILIFHILQLLGSLFGSNLCYQHALLFDYSVYLTA